MPKPVAVEGDTQIETSKRKLPADTNQSGSWQLVTSRVITGQKISVGGKKVEIAAVAAWIYSGGSSGSPPVTLPPIPDTADLQGSTQVLQDLGQGILCDGDEACGKVESGNKITVSASQSIITAD
ncbi:MAG: hypothetical protein R3B09_28900 [Nannocystaceae bacterium]